MSTKIKVEVEDLIEALKKVRPGLASKEFIEQSTSFAFQDGHVITYNDEISVRHPIEQMSGMTGAVNSRELFLLLQKLEKSKKTITMEMTENELLIRAGRVKTGLQLQSEILLPLEEVEVDHDKFRKLPDGVIDAFRLVSYSCATDMSRPALACVHVNGNVIESTDNIRITQCQLESKVSKDSMLIPGTSVKEIIDYPIIKMTTSEDNSWIHFLTEDETILSCRLIEGKFPDTSKMLDVSGTKVNFPEEIIDALSRAEIFARREHVLEEEVRVEFVEKGIKIESKSDTGWFEETVDYEHELEDTIFSVHPVHLKAILGTSHITSSADSDTPPSKNPWAGQKADCIVSKQKDRMKFIGEGWQHVIALRTK